MIIKLQFIFCILLIITLVTFFLTFKVNVECRTQSGDCPSEINIKISAMNGKFFLQAKSGVVQILKNNLLVSAYTTQFKLPNLLMINVILKKPIFSIFNKSSNKYVMIDGNGHVISVGANSSLPTIIKDTDTSALGGIVGERDLFSLELIQGIDQMYQISRGTIQNDTLVVDLPQDIRVIFPVDGDTQTLLGGLRLIYSKVTAEYAGKYHQIDMRYKNPVLR